MSTLREIFSDIADAIRAKAEITDTMTPAEMPTKIGEIETGKGGIVVDDLHGLFGSVTNSSTVESRRWRTLCWWDIHYDTTGELPGLETDTGRPKISVMGTVREDMSYAFANCGDTDDASTKDVLCEVYGHGSMDHAFFGCKCKSLTFRVVGRSSAGWPQSSGSFYYAFVNCSAQHITLDGSIAYTAADSFSNNSTVRFIDGLLIYGTGNTKYARAFKNCTSLERITFHDLQNYNENARNGAVSPIDLSTTALTVDGANSLFASLPDINGLSSQSYGTITITGTPAASGLTADDIAVATGKGWTVTI